jgi:hypothetical protein
MFVENYLAINWHLLLLLSWELNAVYKYYTYYREHRTFICWQTAIIAIIPH